MLGVENKQLSDFNFRLPNTCNILCNNTYLCKWNVILKKNNNRRRHKCLTRFTVQDEAFPSPLCCELL